MQMQSSVYDSSPLAGMFPQSRGCRIEELVRRLDEAVMVGQSECVHRFGRCFPTVGYLNGPTTGARKKAAHCLSMAAALEPANDDALVFDADGFPRLDCCPRSDADEALKHVLAQVLGAAGHRHGLAHAS